MKIHLLLFIVVLSSPLKSTTAFESDELLANDDEFEGVFTNPNLSPPPIRHHRKPDLDSSSSSDSNAIQFDLEHAFGDSEFSTAGTFTARLKSWTHGGQRLLREDDFYTIRVPSNVLNSPGKEYVVSSIRARCIPRESLDEHFIIHTDGVNILAVNYGSAGACPFPRLLKLPTKWSFNSYTVLKTSEQARRTPTFAEEMIEAGIAEDEGVKLPEKSLWAKYWMYLIPVGMIAMNAITQAMNMPEEQATGQPGGQAQPNGAAVRRR